MAKLLGKKVESPKGNKRNIPKHKAPLVSKHVPLFNNFHIAKPKIRTESQQTKRPPLRNITNTALNTNTRFETSHGLREITKGIII